MKVLVTGGNGFIGSATVRALIESGHAVRCLLRDSSDTARIDGLSWEPAPGDVRDPQSLREAARACDGVIHLASPSAWRDINSPLLDEVLVRGTRNVLAAAGEAGAARVVYVSSVTAVNGAREPRVFDETAEFTLPRNSFRYARCKVEAEALCRKAAADGLQVVIVNPGEVYGPRDTALITAGNLVDFAKSNPVLVCTGGTSIVHVDDVARGIVGALERGRPGQRYILGGDNLTIEQLASHALRLLGQRKRIVKIPNALLRGVAAAGQALRVPLPFNPDVVPYATLFWFMDNRKARGELGATFRPADEVLAPTLAWLRQAEHIN